MSIQLKYKLVFEGEDADFNRLPAHEGASSLEGLTWSIALLTNYAATGEIRTRGNLSPHIRTYLRPPRQGSFLTELWVVVTQPESIFLSSIIGVYAVNTVSQAVNAIIVKSVKEVCGLAANMVRKEEDWLKGLPSGDLEALVDKIEPSMKRAHTVIGDGASTLTIKKGYTPLVQLDHLTKAFVNADLKGDEKTISASVGAFNANTGNGRVFLADIGKTVPFYVEKGLDFSTYSALSHSLNAYVNGWPSLIEIVSTEVLSQDGRLKRLLISQARKIQDGD